MSTPSDLTLSALDLVYGLINDANPNHPKGVFDFNSVAIGTPQPLTNHPSGHNTQVVLTAVPGSGYSGEVTVTFDRLNLSDVFASKGVSGVLGMSGSGFSDSYSLLDSLNGAYTLNLQQQDVVLESLPAADQTTGDITYTLQAHPNSLAFQGTQDITISPVKFALMMAVQNRLLPGFTTSDAKAIELKSVVLNTDVGSITVADVTT